MPLASGQSAARRRPDWRFEVHPNLGHVPMLEDADWTAGVIVTLAAVWTVGVKAQACGARAESGSESAREAVGHAARTEIE